MGRRFLGAGGQDNFSGIFDSRAVGVVEHSSSFSEHSSLVALVDIGFRGALTAIPAITHFLPSDSLLTSTWCFLEKPMLEKKKPKKGEIFLKWEQILWFGDWFLSKNWTFFFFLGAKELEIKKN